MSMLNKQLNDKQKKGPVTSRPLFDCQTTGTSWIEIDRAQFKANVTAVKQLIGQQVNIAAVIKSDAYGHGLLPLAQLCQEHEHVAYVIVFSLSNALSLRAHGVDKPILVWGGYDEPLKFAVEHAIDTLVFDWPSAQEICARAQEVKKIAQVHIKVDTGLARLGFQPNEVLNVVEFLHRCPYIKIVGICSHFASSDAPDLTFTHQQLAIYQDVCKKIAQNGLNIAYRHIANSIGTLRLPETHQTMVRCGRLLYGIYKQDIFCQMARERSPNFELAPIIRWKTRVSFINELPTNTLVGYASTYKTERTTKIAVVPVGYFDGYDRRLSNCGHMLVRGQLAPVLGRVAMNLTTLDVTDIPGVTPGDEVTIISAQNGIRPRDIAAKIDIIEHEVTTRLSAQVPRIII